MTAICSNVNCPNYDPLADTTPPQWCSEECASKYVRKPSAPTRCSVKDCFRRAAEGYTVCQYHVTINAVEESQKRATSVEPDSRGCYDPMGCIFSKDWTKEEIKAYFTYVEPFRKGFVWPMSPEEWRTCQPEEVSTPSSKLLDLHRTLCDRARQIMVSKNTDYCAGQPDINPYANFDVTESVLGLDGRLLLIARILDKIQRLRGFLHTGQLAVKDEAVDNCLVDIINYSVLFAGMTCRSTNSPSSPLSQKPSEASKVKQEPHTVKQAQINLKEFLRP